MQYITVLQQLRTVALYESTRVIKVFFVALDVGMVISVVAMLELVPIKTTSEENRMPTSPINYNLS